MKHAASLVISNEFRSLVATIADRLEAVRVIAPGPWRKIADQFDLGERETRLGRPLVVGPPAHVLKHARAETGDFGFVTPDAQFAKPWQRAQQWRDDTTLALWAAGWSPLTVDRLLVPINGAVLEYLIGTARRTPNAVGEVASSQ